eukprot:m.440212 g.440212  ORF g.440212 m.440212 type:complete len:472 (-) comp21465_c0_seq6:183-1598(-)
MQSPNYAVRKPLPAIHHDRKEYAYVHPLNPSSQAQCTGEKACTQRNVQSIDNYELGDTIGDGTFAKVKTARHKLTGVKVAIKVINKNKLRRSTLQHVTREAQIHRTLDHPNIVKMLEVIDTDDVLYLVLEFVPGGDLFDYVIKHKRLLEHEARKMFRQILSAVEYCHLHGIVHRDLKLENVVLDENRNVKVADFGLSTQFLGDADLSTFCGTIGYCAPELLQGRAYDGTKVDVWSLGVILYTLVCGSLPFNGKCSVSLSGLIIQGQYHTPTYMSKECNSFLKRFLNIEPEKRTSVHTAMCDPWMKPESLRPQEPSTSGLSDAYDDARLDYLVSLKHPEFTRKRIMKSVFSKACDYYYASYVLVGVAFANGLLSRPEPRGNQEHANHQSLSVTTPKRTMACNATGKVGTAATDQQDSPVRPVAQRPPVATPRRRLPPIAAVQVNPKPCPAKKPPVPLPRLRQRQCRCKQRGD